jgi:hypothetical protein
MGLHEIKKPLHNERNGHQIEEVAHKMEGNLPAIYLMRRSKSQNKQKERNNKNKG